jgi:hypothetical protein
MKKFLEIRGFHLEAHAGDDDAGKITLHIDSVSGDPTAVSQFVDSFGQLIGEYDRDNVMDEINSLVP